MRINHALGIGIAGCLILAAIPAFGIGSKEAAPTPADVAAAPAEPQDVPSPIDPRSGGTIDWVAPESEFFEPVDLDEAIAVAKQVNAKNRSSRSADPAMDDPANDPRQPLVSSFLSKAQELPGPTFAGAFNRASDGIAETWWKGKAPDYVYDLVPKAKEAGIEFIIHEDAKFSRIELKEAVERLDASPLTKTLNVSFYGLGYNGSGINIYFAGKAPNPLPVDELRKAAGIDCDFFVSEEDLGEMSLDSNRHTDTAPYSGGARINFSYNYADVGSCTSGFPVVKGNVGYLTTANHCDPTNNKMVTNGIGGLIANKSSWGLSSIDTKLIDPIASPATGPYIYTGPSWNSTQKSRITSVNRNSLGDYVCLSGATSGKRCSTIIDDAYPGNKLPTPGLVGDWYIIAKASSGWAAAGGDSGGAWYQENSNGTVQARGGHIGSYHQVPCSGLAPDAKGAKCKKFAYYVPATVIQNSLKVKIER